MEENQETQTVIETKPDLILLDTTLTMIVRDEEMNPAGGIERMLRAHLPHVQSAVVVDTGSVDRTREILEMLQGEFPCLEVYGHRWRDFSDARNYSLKKVKTKRALVLDADEVITDDNKSIVGGFEKLQQCIEEKPKQKGYSFNFWNIGQNYSNENSFGPGHNPRLFSLHRNLEYSGKDGEVLIMSPGVNLFAMGYLSYNGAFKNKIAHFLPKTKAISEKWIKWYDSSHYGMKFLTEQPLENAKINGWKEYNPRRDEFA